MKMIHEPHKPHCAYLCSGTPPEKTCDCGAAPALLELALSPQAANLVLRGVKRLDADDARGETMAFLADILTGFVEATRKVPLLERLRTLLATKNLTSEPGDEHPLPFSDVVKAIAKALAVRMEIDPLDKLLPGEEPLGIGSFGRYDGPNHQELAMLQSWSRRVTHVFALAIVDGAGDNAPMTIGLAANGQCWAESQCFWPELSMPTNAWAEHRRRYVAWMRCDAADRIHTTRGEAERLVAAMKAR